MRYSAEGPLLARAYELRQTTDLSFTEIERALEIRSGTLRRSLQKACAHGDEMRRKTASDTVFDYLMANGERRTYEIHSALDYSPRAIQEALLRLRSDGKIVSGRCRVDRRIKTHRVSKWLI